MCVLTPAPSRLAFVNPHPHYPGKVTLSSGGTSTMHADSFNARDQKELNRLVVNCIHRVLPSKPRPN
jgi:hypothetical protein